MNALNESARGVDTAWCKGDLRAEAEAKDAGDTYCAVGHLAKSLAESQGLDLSFNGEYVGTPEQISAVNAIVLELRKTHSQDRIDELVDQLKSLGLRDTYEFVEETDEAKHLAETILANYRDRLNNGTSEKYIERAIKEEEWHTIIWQFNDDRATTREDVIAMMEKAAISLDDAAVAEDKSTDELVEEINELIDA